MTEYQVFRLTPKENKYYATATYKRRTGRWPNEEFYTTEKPTYVGRFIRHESIGYRDNAEHWDIFENNGIEVIVRYTYEGTTCFVEASPKINIELKEEIIQAKIFPLQVPSLKDLAKMQLSSEEIRLLNEIEIFK